ncbi:MAG TPA: TIGR03067 domain-containing protein [Pirellulales bacterium]|nr:TIGR03067 domain-containing protein [Pirellulales bacterium]
MCVQWALALAMALVAADAAKGAADKDIQLWQGTWRVVSMETDGRMAPAEKLANMKLTVSDLDYQFQNGDFSERGSYKFDAAKEPRHVDIVVGPGPDKGKIYLAIYQVQGNKLTICLDAANRIRPIALSGKAGSGCVLEVWQRVKPSPDN